MYKFTIPSNVKYLNSNVQGYYHTDYTRFQNPGNPDYLNFLKNDFNNKSYEILLNAEHKLREVLENDLSSFDKNLTICIVPRSNAENAYVHNQLLFKKIIQSCIEKLNFQDGSNYIVRHTDTITTHLNRSGYGGKGDTPYPGITKNTCNISSNVNDKNVLLIDDIYTTGVEIDEDVIQALFDNGANSILFYAVGKTV